MTQGSHNNMAQLNFELKKIKENKKQDNISNLS